MTPPIRPESTNPRLNNMRKLMEGYRAQGATAQEIQELIQKYHPNVIGADAPEPMTLGDNVRGVIANLGEGVGFSFADEAMGGLRGAIDPRITMSEGVDQVRDERDRFADRNPKTALGLTLGGGVLPALLTAGASAAPSAARVAGTTAAQGAVAGYGSGEGDALSASRLGRGAVGGVAGGVVGGVVAKVANSRVGDAVARGGRNLLEAVTQAADGPAAATAGRAVPEAFDAATSGALRSIAARTGGAEAVPQARTLLQELEQAGLGRDAIAADVLPAGGRELKRAFNVSPQAQAAGRTQLLERGARVGERSRDALSRATGLSPQTTAAGVDDLVAARAAKAKPLYDAAMTEGRGKVATPQLQSFLGEPSIQRTMARLRELDAFRNLPDDSPEMLDGIYKVLSDRHATIKAAQVIDPENLGRFDKANLESMKGRFLDALSEPGSVDVPLPPLEVAQSPAMSLRDAISAHQSRLGQAASRSEGTAMQRTAREALERRSAEAAVPAPVYGTPAPRSVRQEVPAVMPSYRKAVTQFADDSQLKDAYEAGVQMFNQPVGDIQSQMAKMTPDELELFKRGAFDALLEKRVGPASPNADLGEFARQSKRAGQATVDNEPAAARVRAIFGDEEYQRIVGAARGEGRFTQTANDALANSSTAQQLGDMGVFGEMAQKAIGANPASPSAWARGAGFVGDKMRSVFDEPASRRAGELLTGNPKTLLEMLEQLSQSDAARRSAVQPVMGVAARTTGSASRP